MNIVDEVLREYSKAMKDRVIRYVGQNPARFTELIDAFLKGPYRVTQRAAWPLSFIVEKHPDMIKPHLRKVIGTLTPTASVSTKRNVMRLLQFVDIPRSLQGPVLSAGFDFLNDPKETIAVRVFSMTVIASIAREQPEIGKELVLIIEDQLPFGSAGFINRGTRILKALKK